MQRFNTYQTAPVPSGGSDWQAEINGGGQTEARSVGDARSWQSPGDRSTSPCPVDR